MNKKSLFANASRLEIFSPLTLSAALLGALGASALFSAPATGADEHPQYLNPVAVVASADGQAAYVALAGTRQIATVDIDRSQVVKEKSLDLPPTGLSLHPTQPLLAVSMGEAEGKVVLIDTRNGAVLQDWEARFSPCAPTFVRQGRVLAVCNRFLNDVAFYEVPSGRLLGTSPTGREPITATTDSNGKRLFIGTHMPSQSAISGNIGLTVEVFDAQRFGRIKTIHMPNGSTGLQSIVLSPDERWLFVTHVLGHYELPTNQLERGWMNSNAITVIDTQNLEILGTALLDDTTLGAANPWGIGVTEDSQYLAVTHSGLHEMSRIPLQPFLAILKGAQTTGDGDDSYGEGHDLTVMVRSGRIRIKLPGEGSRALTITGGTALVCEYFSGQLAVVDLDILNPDAIKPKSIKLGIEPPMDAIRRGEMRFSDARLCFQGWQSCISCHPSVRTDGLNWDLLNDGIGNPKQTKSLLFSHVTPPAMIHGVRAKAEIAVRAGVRFIQFAQVVEDDAKAIDEYLKALEPLPSPFLTNGDLSPAALRGRKIFNDIGCIKCHSGEYYTDQRLHRIGHATEASLNRSFDTPTLREVWRTGPYLYDGRATTIEQALRIKNNRGVAELSEEELFYLSEYVRSL